jgi:urease accessory protein
MGRRTEGRLHPPLPSGRLRPSSTGYGEGRTTEGGPGWGVSQRDIGSAIVESLSPPPTSSETEEVTSPLQGEVQQIFAANRAHGRVSLTLAATPRGTRRTVTREEGSLRVRFPGACAGAPEAVLVNTAGGIAGGDRFAIELDLEAGAELIVTTAAAEKIYRSLGPDASIDVTAQLADGAALTWLPQETILFDRARLVRTVDITLAPSSTLLFAETVVFGRTAMGETVRQGLFTDRWRVRRGERLIFAENFRLDGAIADHLAESAIAKGHTAIGTVLLAPGDDTAIAAARAAADRFRGEVGISAWSNSAASSIALVRLAAPDGALLRHDLAVLLSALGRDALPRNWLH